MYKYLLSVFIITLLSISCNDEESTADRFAGVYAGTLVEFECDFDQTELSNETATATLTRVDDTELSIDIDVPNGDDFLFSAEVTSSFTLLINPFPQNLDTLSGDVFRDGSMSRLTILLISDCDIFGTETATFIFEEN